MAFHLEWDQRDKIARFDTLSEIHTEVSSDILESAREVLYFQKLFMKFYERSNLNQVIRYSIFSFTIRNIVYYRISGGWPYDFSIQGVVSVFKLAL